MSCFTTIRFFLQATSLSKLEAEEKARKALEADNKRQVESIRADFDQALIDGREIVLQSPDGYVVLRNPKGVGDDSMRTIISKQVRFTGV